MKSINLNDTFCHEKIRSTIEWLLCIGIMCSHYVEMILLCICILLIFKDKHNLKLNKIIFYFLIGLGGYSIVLVWFSGYTYDKFFQQFSLISFYIISYSIIFLYLKKNINNLFEKYLKVVLIVAILGIVQWFIYIIFNKNIFYILYHRSLSIMDYGLIRISSIIDEPGYLSIVITPAVVYYLLYNFFPIKIKKLIIIGICILTFSAVSYVVIILAIIYKLFRHHKFVIVNCCLFIPLSLSLVPNLGGYEDSNIFNGVSERIEDSFEGLKYFDPIYFEHLNLSSYTLVSNLWVALNAPNRITGTGLGTHEQNYYFTYKSSYQYYGFNSTDGYSLLNRIFSEFGIIGILILFYFIYKNFNKNSIINICAFFLILSFIMKGGHYVRYGLIFWFFMYYYSHINSYFNSILVLTDIKN